MVKYAYKKDTILCLAWLQNNILKFWRTKLVFRDNNSKI